MFCQKHHQIIKHGYVKTYLRFSTILIYNWIYNARKNIVLYFGTVIIMVPKSPSKNDEPSFSAYSQYAAFGILFTKQIFGWHFFQREIECFIECLVECVQAIINNQKYILITVLRENIQKGILQQMTNVYLFQKIFFLFFKIFELNVYVLVY